MSLNKTDSNLLSLDGIDFNLYTREEAIKFLESLDNPNHESLIHWIKESVQVKSTYYDIRVAIAKAEDAVKRIPFV